MKRERRYQKIVITLVIFNFLIRVPFLNLPAHWDEFSYFEGVARVFKNNLNPFIEFWSYKPPLLFELTALLYQLFGVSRWIGRLIITISSSLGIFLTYTLGKKIFNPKTGLWAAILLFLSPLYFTQGNLFHVEILLTVLFLATLYFYLSNNLVFYLVFAGLLVLTKEPAVLMIISLVCFDFVVNFRNISMKKLLKKEVTLLSPLIVFIAWMFLNKKFLGWYFWPYNVSYFSFSERPYPRPDFNIFFSVSFQEQLLWFIYGLPFFGLLFSLALPSLKKKIFKREFLYLFFLSIFFPLVFYLGAFLPRYSLFVYPGLFLSFAWTLDNIFQAKRKLISSILVLICILFVIIPIYSLFFSPKIPGWAGERDMSYLRFVWLGKRVTSFVEERFPDRTIVTDWPISSMFENPLFGYVGSHFDVIELKDCRRLDKVKGEFLLITSIRGGGRIEECARKRSLKLVKEIKVVKIYHQPK